MKLLFVCMGNICRSPTAEGVFRHFIGTQAPDFALEIDSAGTHDYHVGEPPDPRTVAAAARRGIDLSGLRARQVADADFQRFDLIVAMDRFNQLTLLERSPPQYRARIRTMLEFVAGLGRDVPDPYYGGPAGFDTVLDLIAAAAPGLLAEIRSLRRGDFQSPRPGRMARVDCRQSAHQTGASALDRIGTEVR